MPAPAVLDVGTGPIVGTPGPVRGVRPSYSDPRVWTTPDQVVSAPLSPSERLDSVLNVRLAAHEDSMLAAGGAGPRRAAGDWTYEKDGKKYGMDSKYIRLGKVSIPTTLLALLPLNLGNNMGNVQQIERERALGRQRVEIMEQAQRAMNEEDFRKAVRAIRERKQRERERLLASKGEQSQEKQKAATP